MASLNADLAARARTAMDLADAEVEAESAEKILASVKSAHEAAKFQPVKAPPDAYVWDLIAAASDFVRAGSPVATWVDCSFHACRRAGIGCRARTVADRRPGPHRY